MAKKSTKKASDTKESRKLEKQAEEIKTLSKTLRSVQKDNDKLVGRVRKLEKDDTLSKKLRSLERDQKKSAKRVDSLEKNLKERKSASKSGKSRRPGEESVPVITKAARREATKSGVDLTGVKGTGVEGRITVRDVRKRSRKSGKSGGSRRKSKK